MFSILSAFTIVVASLATVNGIALPAEPTHELSKRMVVSCADTAKRTIIQNALASGKAMAADAHSYIVSRGASDPLVKLYFGNDTSLIPRVSWLYNRIATETTETNYTITCDNDPSGACTSGTVIARNTYLPGPASRIDLCPRFYQRPIMSCTTNIGSMNGSREDTIVHEMSHGLGRTTDYNGSCSSSRNLALNNATAAANHAYAHGCFAMEVYKVLHC